MDQELDDEPDDDPEEPEELDVLEELDEPESFFFSPFEAVLLEEPLEESLEVLLPPESDFLSPERESVR